MRNEIIATLTKYPNGMQLSLLAASIGKYKLDVLKELHQMHEEDLVYTVPVRDPANMVFREKWVLR